MKYSNYTRLLLIFSPVPFKRGHVSPDTSQTNDTNYKIQNEVNKTNLAMNQANNDLQLRLQREMNEFNSLEQQMKRAVDAGVNPNAVIDGSISGNLQNSLPTTQAGHVDAFRAENPYMEKMANLQFIRDVSNDVINNSLTGAQADLVRAQTIGQQHENNFIDDLRGLSLAMGRKQMEVMNEQIKNMVEERQVIINQSDLVKANFSLASEQAYQQGLQNYFSEERYNTTLGYIREHFDELGIPRKEQLTDDDIKAIYYGYPIELGLNISATNKNIADTAYSKASSTVQYATRNFLNAQTDYQYGQNAIQKAYGMEQARANVEFTQQQTRTSNEQQDVYRTQGALNRQQKRINSWMETPQAQSQFVIGQAQHILLEESATFNNNMQGVNNSRGFVGDIIGSGKRQSPRLPGIVPNIR